MERRGREGLEETRGALEEVLHVATAGHWQITAKPLEHLRSGCCMSPVAPQHDLTFCSSSDARARSERHILTVISSDRFKNSVWLTKPFWH